MAPIAMILAAGVGSRLQPLTDKTPKALLHFRTKTMLEHVIEKLKLHGITEVVINIHHHAEQIVEFVRKHDDFGINISFSDEQEQLMDTGGAIVKARELLEGRGPFLVHNVDIFTDLDLNALYHSHMEGRALATLAVRERETSRNLLVDRSGRLCGWRDNKSGKTVMVEGWKNRFGFMDGHPESGMLDDALTETDPKPVAFSGIHVIAPEIFEMLDSKEPFSIIEAYLDMAGGHKIVTYDHSSGHWFDMARKENFPGLIGT
ncbi:MAG: nucleotidyltransferase family protein [Bacteroidales bacterium]